MQIKKIVKKEKLKIFVICRLSSTRLKLKIKSKILGKSILEILILRLLKSFEKYNIIICSAGKKNKFFEDIKNKYNINIFYGSEKNLFDRINFSYFYFRGSIIPIYMITNMK